MKLLLKILCIFLTFSSCAQPSDVGWKVTPPAQYHFIKYDDNIISDLPRLDSFYHKLLVLKNTHKGKVSIIHLGDSHLQADGITSVLRNGFHDYFGDGGRGLVFPYQLAGSNAPHDISSWSNISWKGNRLLGRGNQTGTGISGFGIHSTSGNAVVGLKLKAIDGRQEKFNRMVFFLCNDSACYRIKDSSIAVPLVCYAPGGEEGRKIVVNSDTLMTGFQLTKSGAPAGCDGSFYGVSLERTDTCGVLYHTIGVNGARFDQFTHSALFWKQLKALDGDLFILSMGTNEAQDPHLNEAAFMATCDTIVRMIKQIAPNAQVLFTTPAGSYYQGKKPNPSLQKASNAIKTYCRQTKHPFWDLYEIGGGLEGTPNWKKSNLLSHDGVHYNNEGYALQGSLLLGALAKGYNYYEQTRPARVSKPSAGVNPTGKPGPQVQTERKIAALAKETPKEPHQLEKPVAVPITPVPKESAIVVTTSDAPQKGTEPVKTIVSVPTPTTTTPKVVKPQPVPPEKVESNPADRKRKTNIQVEYSE